VHFLGPSQDPLGVLRGADVFVHPSWAEAFPYVLLEAMSVGLPIVASDVGGIGEALVDGDSGSLVAPGDPEALARALIALLDDTGRGARMGEAAKRRVEQRFSRQAMIDGLIDVYDDVLGSPSSIVS
jgi:glycosyltransferase involved in cell wall biosynthesis